jgi:hypothetical protein
MRKLCILLEDYRDKLPILNHSTVYEIASGFRRFSCENLNLFLCSSPWRSNLFPNFGPEIPESAFVAASADLVGRSFAR